MIDIFKDINLFWNKYKIIFIIIIILILFWLIFTKSDKIHEYNELYSALYKNTPKTQPIKKCKDSKTEVECKRLLEHRFKKPFIKIRPDWLKNESTGKNLEIDLYNSELKLGIEVQGMQHYIYVPHFHRTKENFTKQQLRDEYKRRRCQELGIILIEIPYDVDIKDVENYLEKELQKNGY